MRDGPIASSYTSADTVMAKHRSPPSAGCETRYSSLRTTAVSGSASTDDRPRWSRNTPRRGTTIWGSALNSASPQPPRSAKQTTSATRTCLPEATAVVVRTPGAYAGAPAWRTGDSASLLGGVECAGDGLRIDLGRACLQRESSHAELAARAARRLGVSGG